MKIIKFNDFMAKNHEIIGLTHEEKHFSETFKYLIYILIAVIAIAIPMNPIVPISGAIDAFLYM